MIDVAKSFPRVVSRRIGSGEELLFEAIQPGQLLTITLEHPGLTRIVLLVGQPTDDLPWGQLVGLLQPGTQLSTNTEAQLRRDNFDLPLQNERAAIIGSCPFDSLVDSFYRAVSTIQLTVGECLLWGVAWPFPNRRVSLILGSGRITQLEVRSALDIS